MQPLASLLLHLELVRLAVVSARADLRRGLIVVVQNRPLCAELLAVFIDPDLTAHALEHALACGELLHDGLIAVLSLAKSRNHRG